MIREVRALLCPKILVGVLPLDEALPWVWSGVLSLSDPSRRRFDQRALPTQCRGRLAAWFGDTSSSHRCLESRSITLFFRREDTSVGHSLRANHRIALPDKQKQTVRCPPPSGRIFQFSHPCAGILMQCRFRELLGIHFELFSLLCQGSLRTTDDTGDLAERPVPSKPNRTMPQHVR